MFAEETPTRVVPHSDLTDSTPIQAPRPLTGPTEPAAGPRRRRTTATAWRHEDLVFYQHAVLHSVYARLRGEHRDEFTKPAESSRNTVTESLVPLARRLERTACARLNHRGAPCTCRPDDGDDLLGMLAAERALEWAGARSAGGRGEIVNWIAEGCPTPFARRMASKYTRSRGHLTESRRNRNRDLGFPQRPRVPQGGWETVAAVMAGLDLGGLVESPEGLTLDSAQTRTWLDLQCTIAPSTESADHPGQLDVTRWIEGICFDATEGGSGGYADFGRITRYLMPELTPAEEPAARRVVQRVVEAIEKGMSQRHTKWYGENVWSPRNQNRDLVHDARDLEEAPAHAGGPKGGSTRRRNRGVEVEFAPEDDGFPDE